jgi:hypothetical protein
MLWLLLVFVQVNFADAELRRESHSRPTADLIFSMTPYLLPPSMHCNRRHHQARRQRGVESGRLIAPTTTQ